MRALAVLLVVYAHCSDTEIDYHPSYKTPFFQLHDFGAIGLDLFFVISGFIICMISYNYLGITKAKKFLVKRLIRIGPLYWIISVGWFFYDQNHGLRAIIKTLIFIPLFDFSETFIKPVFFVGWTLSFEFYFYLVMTVLLYAGNKKYITYLIFYFLVIIAAGQVISYRTSLWTFMTNPIIIEFLLGCMVWVLYTKYVHFFIKRPFWILVTGAIVFFANIFYIPAGMSEAYLTLNGYLSLKRALFWGVPSSLLLLGVILAEKKYNPKIPGWIVSIGDASYSIYLFHLPFIKILFAIWAVFPVLFSHTLVIFTVGFVLIIGYLVYRYFERPLLSYLNNLIMSKIKPVSK